MKIIEKILLSVVISLHLYFLILEMFLWTTPIGIESFKMTEIFAQESKVLAANQGLYNGFLAVGLLLSFFIKNVPSKYCLRRYLLACVVVAGVYGGLTVGTKIFVIQAIPAILALGASFIVTKKQLFGGLR